MINKTIHTCFLLLLSTFFSFATESEYYCKISKTNSKIKIDGVLDEAVWQNAPNVEEFWEHYPIDSIKAPKKTEVRLTYDDDFIYISAICHDSRTTPIVQSLIRDDGHSFWLSDAFSLVIDPLQSGKNGYFFGVNAGGGEIDALVAQNGLNPSFDNFWSNKWYSAVSQNEKGFVYEMAIPFNIMNIDKNTTWGFNFIRNDMEFKNSYQLWTKFKITHDGRDLGFLGNVEFDSIPDSKSGRITVIPSLTTKAHKEIEAGIDTEYDLIYGMDARIGLSQKSNLDIMLIPDFSQADVDREYLDFGRYEYYMQEQRQFFLENSDLFTDFGSKDFKPIYTRRIGILDWEYYKIWAGARVTGIAGKNFRYGLLNVHTDDFNGELAKNFTISTFQKSFNQLTVKGLYTNVEQFSENKHIRELFNRTAGIDLQYSTKNDKFDFYGGINKSFSEDQHSDSYYANAGVDYISRHFKTLNSINIANENYINDLGFFNRMYAEDAENDTVLRKGVIQVKNWFEYKIYPKENSPFSYYFPYIEHKTYLQQDGKLEEDFWATGMHLNHKNTSYSLFYFWHSSLNLPYDISILDDQIIEAGDYISKGAGIYHNTDNRKMFTYRCNLNVSEYYRGAKVEYFNKLTWTLMPWIKVNADYTYCRVERPEEINNRTYHLAGFQSDIFFSKDMIWTTLVQLNTQNQRFKINSRFQWRYSPMSNIYIVFAENFDSDDFSSENMTITAKVNYWLSI